MKKIKTEVGKLIDLKWLVIFLILPLILNVFLHVTDIVYQKCGFTLTAKGLNNKEWLEFFGMYLPACIAFLGIITAIKTAREERIAHRNETVACQYERKINEEKKILLNVCHSFNTDMVRKSFLEICDTQINSVQIQQSRRELQKATECILDAQAEFELLTEIIDVYVECEKCGLNHCCDYKIKKEIKGLYYQMEQIYLDTINLCNKYIDQILQRTSRDLKDIGDSVEIQQGKITDEEIKKMSQDIIKGMNKISQDMRPKLIGYCKSYLQWKNLHWRELLDDGKINYKKCEGTEKIQEF